MTAKIKQYNLIQQKKSSLLYQEFRKDTDIMKALIDVVYGKHLTSTQRTVRAQKIRSHAFDMMEIFL